MPHRRSLLPLEHAPIVLWTTDRHLRVTSANGSAFARLARVVDDVVGKTITTYRARVLRKMVMRTNAELTFYAMQQRLLTAPILGTVGG